MLQLYLLKLSDMFNRVTAHNKLYTAGMNDVFLCFEEIFFQLAIRTGEYAGKACFRNSSMSIAGFDSRHRPARPIGVNPSSQRPA